jgi:hypothetical protein
VVFKENSSKLDLAGFFKYPTENNQQQMLHSFLVFKYTQLLAVATLHFTMQ